MSANEFGGLLPFILEEGVLSEFGVKAHLFVAGDAIHGARMLVEDFVVAGPEFVGEVGASRNETVKLHGVANGPGEQAGEKNGGSEQDGREAKGMRAELAESNPCCEERQKGTKSRICEKRYSPEQSVKREIAGVRIVCDFQSGPKQHGRQEGGE